MKLKHTITLGWLPNNPFKVTVAEFEHIKGYRSITTVKFRTNGKTYFYIFTSTPSRGTCEVYRLYKVKEQKLIYSTYGKWGSEGTNMAEVGRQLSVSLKNKGD